MSHPTNGQRELGKVEQIQHNKVASSRWYLLELKVYSLSQYLFFPKEFLHQTSCQTHAKQHGKTWSTSYDYRTYCLHSSCKLLVDISKQAKMGQLLSGERGREIHAIASQKNCWWLEICHFSFQVKSLMSLLEIMWIGKSYHLPLLAEVVVDRLQIGALS